MRCATKELNGKHIQRAACTLRGDCCAIRGASRQSIRYLAVYAQHDREYIQDTDGPEKHYQQRRSSKFSDGGEGVRPTCDTAERRRIDD